MNHLSVDLLVPRFAGEQVAAGPTGLIRVVVVDDHKLLCDCLALRLDLEVDIEVVGTAGSARAGYACVQTTDPDLVLLDLHLPDENGLLTTARIRRAFPRTKVLVLTGDPSPAAPRDALLAGASGFLSKEEETDNLIQAVRLANSGRIYLSPGATTAITNALAAPPVQSRASFLTERELSVLKRLADGMSYKEIGNDLNLGVKSVETYRARLVKKTGCTTRAELVRYAIREGIIVA